MVLYPKCELTSKNTVEKSFIDMSNFAVHYKNAIIDVTSMVTGEEKGILKKVVKNIEKTARFSR